MMFWMNFKEVEMESKLGTMISQSHQQELWVLQVFSFPLSTIAAIKVPMKRNPAAINNT